MGLRQLRGLILAAALLVLVLVGCGGAGSPASSDTNNGQNAVALPEVGRANLANGEQLRVVATTSIVGDVVARVGGDAIDLTVLMQPGQDPHSFQAAARDLARAGEAHVIFVNGFDLEEGLLSDLESAAPGVPIVPISAGIEPLEFEGEHEEEAEEEEGHEHEGTDPHVWFDAHNVEIWTDNVAASLSALDPANAETYEANADSYRAELEALDQFIHDAIEQIPEANRKLVTNHDNFQYFALAYGFEVIGTVLPSFSTNVEPSANDLAGLIRIIRDENVPAIFVETTMAEQLADTVAQETGARVYQLYTDALGPPGSGADSYVGLMRANAETLVEALAGGDGGR
jgi:ABC-type Zn uptake system ZnuABC Zn-binding protein ZnuA